MESWFKEIAIPLFTFLFGIIIEYFRQSHSAKKADIEKIDNKLRELIKIFSDNPRNIALLKYEYNFIHSSIKIFCLENGLNMEFINDDLINLNLNATSHSGSSDEIAKYSISIIEKIRKL